MYILYMYNNDYKQGRGAKICGREKQGYFIV